MRLSAAIDLRSRWSGFRGLAAVAAAWGFLGPASMPAEAQQPAAPPAQEAASPSWGPALPLPDPRFNGAVGRTYQDSRPDFPQPVRPPSGAPNVLLIMLDDVGFGQFGTFGGGIPTPSLDQLAAQGLRYTRFHTTALCSPTRAALLTGQNHQMAATGVVMEMSTGFPGYAGSLPLNAASVAQILRLSGYATAAFGKWHNTPDWETGPTGPFDRWPTGQGFEYFYGFLGGDSDQFHPALVENTTRVERSDSRADYHFTTDIADRAIGWMRQARAVDPNRPFFLYMAPGATHAPLQVPREWIERFRGRFDGGWDRYREETLERQIRLGVVPQGTRLTPRPDGLPAWDSLSADQRRLYARYMEVFAGFTAHTDQEMGRLIAGLDQLGIRENTLVVYIVGDNGASPEGTPNGLLNELSFFNAIPEDLAANLNRIDEIGGPSTFSQYPSAWAWAMGTPFRWTKQVASHLGGVRNPAVVSWPRGIAERGGLRTQFHHVIDVAPTILEAAGIRQPVAVNGIAQVAFAGSSMLYTFGRDGANAAGRRRTQYFEMLGNRGIYHDGWWAASLAQIPWSPIRAAVDIDQLPWELYNLDEDFSQATDLAAREPQRLRGLQDLWWAEAARNNALPIDVRAAERFVEPGRPSVTVGRNSFTYYQGMRLPAGAAADTKNRSFAITTEIEIPATGGVEGVLIAQGGHPGGYALFVQNGRLVFHYNLVDRRRTTIVSSEPVPTGRVTVRYEFVVDTERRGPGPGGLGRLFINDRQVGEARIDRTMGFLYSTDETMDIGSDTGTPVSDSYRSPFAFTGRINRVQIDLR